MNTAHTYIWCVCTSKLLTFNIYSHPTLLISEAITELAFLPRSAYQSFLISCFLSVWVYGRCIIILLFWECGVVRGGRTLYSMYSLVVITPAWRGVAEKALWVIKLSSTWARHSKLVWYFKVSQVWEFIQIALFYWPVWKGLGQACCYWKVSFKVL